MWYWGGRGLLVGAGDALMEELKGPVGAARDFTAVGVSHPSRLRARKGSEGIAVVRWGGVE